VSNFIRDLKRTKRRVFDLFVRLFVSLCVASVSSVCPMGERTAMLHRNLRGDKIRTSTNKYTKFGQLIIRKFVNIIANRCHILRLKCTKFDSQRPSIHSFVCPSVCVLTWSTSRSDVDTAEITVDVFVMRVCQSICFKIHLRD